MRAITARLLNMEFKNKLTVLFITVAIIPLCILGLLAYSRSSYAVQEKVYQTLLESTSQVNYSLNYFLGDIEQLSTYIYSNRDIQDVLSRDAKRSIADKHEDELRMTQILDSFVGSKDWDIEIYILGLNGERYFTGDLLPKEYDQYNDNWGLFRKVRQVGGNSVWDTHYSMKKLYDYGSVLSLGRMLKNVETNRPVGYLVIDIMETALTDKYVKAELYPDSQIFLIDRNGNVISGKPSKQQVGTKLEVPYLDTVLGGTKGYFQAKDDAGKKEAVIYDTSGSTGFKLMNIVPVRAVTKETKSIRTLMIVVMAVGIVLAYWLAAILAFHVTNPLRKLRSLMSSVESGDLNVAFSSKYQDDVGRLGQSFNKMIYQIQHLIKENYEKQLQVREAELKTVQAQMNPHFLYNTLDSINWMARLHEVDDISRTVVSLGELLRFSIRKGNHLLPIHEDLKQIRNYLTIQKLRFGSKIQIEILVDPEIESFYTLKLLIQPIVENAIIHGLEPKKDAGTLRIIGRSLGGNVQFVIKDDGVGFDKEAVRLRAAQAAADSSPGSSTGIGLENARKRLELQFGQEASLLVDSEPGVGTTVTIEIPQLGGAGENHV
ncbi:sensor histidine kinase [Paenibacillus glycinis]|uniref:histidine kinase n=1 Tax=Paenibacillus glycinis TaxID=2697035 RepID=A0ABW9XNY8_9BACL|nr:sensor histidine kinase [Paenibacillus glycinis]NBD24146.1 HAMP domain-containing protein [Paenibacillus glycinis]